VSLRAALEYGFRHSPDAAGRGGLRQVTEFGAQMAPVSAKAGGNWSGEGLGQRAMEGGVPGAVHSQRRKNLCVDGRPDFRWRR
jgi:hypothetical protein